MLGIFVILLLLWAGVPEMLFGVKVDATATTFLGLSLCLLTGVLTWDDALKEKGAWDTIVWFAALVMMANFLNKLGLIAWLSESMQGGYKKYSTSGIRNMAIRPGTTMAANHVPQERWIFESVALATNSTTSGLGAVAVMKMQQVMMLAW